MGKNQMIPVEIVGCIYELRWEKKMYFLLDNLGL